MSTWLQSHSLSLPHGRLTDNLHTRIREDAYPGQTGRIDVYSPWAMVSESIEMTIGFESNIIQAVKDDPAYGYNGRINEIREAEYSHLGGTILIYFSDQTRSILTTPERLHTQFPSFTSIVTILRQNFCQIHTRTRPPPYRPMPVSQPSV